ncbi:MAG: glutathione binding-like protein, partial [Deltaproteobacteria bacterium]|nr:glutathione binding-like protein [Deltaproteobacteria bacterium]
YLADAYSIADIATYPWTNSYKMQGQEMEDFPHVARWREAIKDRPAVQRGIALLAEKRRTGPPDEHTRDNLFGNTQFQKR